MLTLQRLLTSVQKFCELVLGLSWAEDTGGDPIMCCTSATSGVS